MSSQSLLIREPAPVRIAAGGLGLARRAIRLRSIIALIYFALSSASVQAADRIALLIGNEKYDSAVGPLKTPHQDIALVSAALSKVGFKVTIVSDADYATMLKAIGAFTSQVADGGPGMISFLYYSGHGAVDAKTKTNYLIPIDVHSTDDTTLWANSIELRDVIDKLSTKAPDAVHFVVFDACRNELELKPPTAKGVVRLERGFVPVAQTSGLLIAYATAPGKTASDEGAYGRILAEEIGRPGIEAVTMFRTVQIRVKDAIGQEPWLTFPALPVMYFAGKDAGPTDSMSAPSVTLQETQDVAELEAFLKRLPNGPYKSKLQERLSQLRSGGARNCVGGRTWPPSSLVVGAANVPKSRAPWFATLRRTVSESEAAIFKGGAGGSTRAGKDQKAFLYFCGGTAVAPDWVLTSAHCVAGFQGDGEKWRDVNDNDLEVAIGVDDLTAVSPPNVYSINRVLLHPDYSRNEFPPTNDIALLRLARRWNGETISLSSSFSQDPAGLDNVHPTGRMLGLTIGFGITPALQNRGGSMLSRGVDREGRPFYAVTPSLREVVLPFVKKEVCQGGDKRSICAGFEFGGADMCNGGSGGPLIAFAKDGCPYQVGVNSWGPVECGSPKAFGVYSRVSSQLKWIKKNVTAAKWVEAGSAEHEEETELSEGWKALVGLNSSEKTKMVCLLPPQLRSADSGATVARVLGKTFAFTSWVSGKVP